MLEWNPPCAPCKESLITAETGSAILWQIRFSTDERADAASELRYGFTYEFTEMQSRTADRPATSRTD
jgi:hypothetical protein